MAAGKIFAISFAVGAVLNATFGSTMNRGAAALQQLSERTRYLNNEQQRLDRAWRQSQSQVQSYAAQMQRLRQQYEQGRISESQYRSGMARAQQGMRTAGMSADEYRNHLARLRREMEQTRASADRLRNAQAARANASAQLDAAKANFGAAIATTGMVAAPFFGAVETAAKFEAAMSKVQAITRANGEEIGRLTAEARRLGETTQFSAQQSAEAMSYLGMAGWNTEQIIAGMPGLLALAAAGGTDLARTADIVSDDLTAFGLSADKAGHMADVFAVTATRTNTNVEMIGETMKYAAPVARAFGASMEETAALTGIMANAGVKASQAGTSLRAGFMRLAGPPKKASKAMDELGISLSDISAQQQETSAALAALGIDMDSVAGEGSHKMVAILRELREKTQGLTNEQKLAHLQMIFGTEAATGWLNVLDAGPEVFEDLVKQMENCDGEAEKMAQVMMNNAKGAIIQLQSALEGAAISVGSLFLPALTDAAKWAAEMTGTFSRWVKEHEGLTKAVVGTGAAIAGLVFGIQAFQLASAAINYVRLAQVFTMLPGAISGAFAGIAALSWPAILAILVLVGVIALAAANFDAVKETSTIVFSHISGTVSAMTAIVQARFSEALNKITEVWNSVTGQSLQSSEMLGAMFNELGFVLGAAFDVAAVIIGTTVSVMINTITSLAQIIGGVVNIVAGIMTLDWARAWKGAGQVVDGVVGASLGTFTTWMGGIRDVFDMLMGKSAEAQRQAEQAQASQEVLAAGRSALPQISSDYMPDEGMMQTAAAAQQTSQATADAAAHAQELSSNVQQTGQATQATTEYMQQLQAVTGQVPAQAGAAFTDMGAQSAAAAQAIGTNLQQIPEQAQTAFQQLPSIAQQGTDGMAQEISQLAAKCQPGGNAFVQAADAWGEKACQSITSWAEQMASAVESRMSAAWSRISTQFGAGLHVNVTTTGAGQSVAVNAEGGIYRKGAFLTTFAEDSAEAAIPLDGSPRAIGLWHKAGEILGVGRGDGDAPRYDVTVNRGLTTPPAEPAVPQVLNAPPISITLHFNGDTSPEKVKKAVTEAAENVQRTFAEQMESYNRERGRLAFG